MDKVKKDIEHFLLRLSQWVEYNTQRKILIFFMDALKGFGVLSL